MRGIPYHTIAIWQAIAQWNDERMIEHVMPEYMNLIMDVCVCEGEHETAWMCWILAQLLPVHTHTHTTWVLLDVVRSHKPIIKSFIHVYRVSILRLRSQVSAVHYVHLLQRIWLCCFGTETLAHVRNDLFDFLQIDPLLQFRPFTICRQQQQRQRIVERSRSSITTLKELCVQEHGHGQCCSFLFYAHLVSHRRSTAHEKLLGFTGQCGLHPFESTGKNSRRWE